MQEPSSAAVLRVLLVEDSETDAKLIVRALRAAGREIVSERVQTAPAMREALALKPWDVVISDWAMPQFSARAALSLVQQLGAAVPFIIVSGTIGEEAAVDAMRAGARDYVLKDNLARLAPAVERELREHQLRHSAAQALKISERRFERLSASGIIGICILDVTGALREANQACLNMLGYSEAELGARSWGELTPPDYADQSAKAFRSLQEQGVAPAWEQQLFRRDGARTWVLVGMATLEGSACIAVISDVSERRLAEERLRQSEEQLRQVQKMEAVGSLAGGIAHDFNNLLTIVLSYSALLAHELDPDDPRRADLQQIHDAGERAAALTQQLLAFSRRQVLQPKVLRLELLIANVEKMLRRLIGEDIDLRVTSAQSLWKVCVDPSQIDQVLINLAVNARDAMPRGGTLTIDVQNVTIDSPSIEQVGALQPGDYVRIDVTDTGTGMDRATQDRMFEPFFTTKEKGRGTGLGLSTVLGIVQQSGGAVAVRSALGAGTTIRLHLPRADGLAHDSAPSRPPPPAPSPRGHETILLVEDDPGVRTLACSVLRRHGYHVMEAAHGGDALLLSERYPKPIHLLVTDVVMPHMGGPQLAARLCAARSNTRVLFMSGYADGATFEHGLLDRRVNFLPKPFTSEQMAHKVRAVLDASQSA